jgi:hypothetical protein
MPSSQPIIIGRTPDQRCRADPADRDEVEKKTSEGRNKHLKNLKGESKIPAQNYINTFIKEPPTERSDSSAG